ncbi:MAG: DEAD/DEAH box helicase family protein [Victivallales bacterium]|nr:DEAD/DEAH box helicase family protein [Victivallales bacterium]
MGTRLKKKEAPVTFGEQLVLFRYFLHILGIDSGVFKKNSLSGLPDDFKESEGLDENQNSNFYRWLAWKAEIMKCQIPVERLRIYDENIMRHTRQIAEKRGGLTWKYFQYLSLLFTEIFLDRYFSDKKAFVDELNAYLDKITAESFFRLSIPHFTEDGLNKLAFMCATGSGKTLLMHMNILQFMHYLNRARHQNNHLAINKIIVLAPNENMSNQHLEELKLSNISATLFHKEDTINLHQADVLVIDMNKLKEEGKVKTVSVDQFEQNNLVLVDEGHRGMSGNVWYDYRTRLSANGFAFEYSATFKQALKSGKAAEEKKLMEEYGRSIIMDYSYKFFYDDGYGKDYRIYNLRSGIDEESRQIYLVGCLLSFYQQVKVFQEDKSDFAAYMVERPLLVYVGNRVTASTTEAELTDVEEVIAFLDQFLRNKTKSIARINALFADDTGLVDGNGNELFSTVFQPLRDLFGTLELDVEAIYMDILRLVFNSTTTADEPRLQVVTLKQIQGEIALRVGGDGEYFGVISIGDTAKLRKMCEDKGIIGKDEEFVSYSFFRSINNKESKINILIGSRKFTEGWNSWRVSTMGLINFAKGEGSQAIQLFGRGVRLRGFQGCLKRSSRLKSITPPNHLHVLETLTIFGIKAQYMEDFRNYLQVEELPVNDNVFEFRLPVINRLNEIMGLHLHVIRVAPGKDFRKQSARLLFDVPDADLMTYITKSKIIIDCRAKVQTIDSTYNLERTALSETHTIPDEALDYLNYDAIFFELELHKNEKGFFNITIDKNRLKEILRTEGLYQLIIPKNHIQLGSFENLLAMNEYATLVLKNYMDRFYTHYKNAWESPFMTYQLLTSKDANFPVDGYHITYTRDNSDDPTGDALEAFLDDIEKILEKDRGLAQYEKVFKQRLLAFDFRNHLYAPLICIKGSSLKIQVSPISLNEDEKGFVDLLKNYMDVHVADFSGKNLYLLRNKSKVGMGFFEAGNFYPDYILWIDTPTRQYINFIDPKGLVNVPFDDPKILFYQTIKEREATMPQPGGKKVILNSFIMSGTKPADLRLKWPGTDKDKWLERNVLCLEHQDCMENMFKKIGCMDSHQRSTTAKSSRNTYLQTLITSFLLQNERKTMSLEQLVSGWSILREPKDIGKALSSDVGAQEWTKAYPDAIAPNEELLQTLMHMIDRHEISVSKDLQVTLIEDVGVSEDAVMDAYYANAAILEIRRSAPSMPERPINRWLNTFAVFQEKHSSFINSAQAGEYAHAA